jgi:hypothetical protein
MLEHVRIHYFEDGGYLYCSVRTFDDAGVEIDLFTGDFSSADSFGTIDLPVPQMLSSDGPHAVGCLASGPIAILAYDVDEP